jgi:hypothetical protein
LGVAGNQVNSDLEAETGHFKGLSLEVPLLESRANRGSHGNHGNIHTHAKSEKSPEEITQRNGRGDIDATDHHLDVVAIFNKKLLSFLLKNCKLCLEFKVNRIKSSEN